MLDLLTRLGITPLPNLEAKFVAANTLTPLHRRGQAGLVKWSWAGSSQS